MRVHGISFLIVIILSKINVNGQTLAVSVLSLLTNGNEKICKSAHHSGTFLIRSFSPHENSSNTVQYFFFTDDTITIQIVGECKKTIVRYILYN
jgi:hypothetical protein